ATDEGLCLLVLEQQVTSEAERRPDALATKLVGEATPPQGAPPECRRATTTPDEDDRRDRPVAGAVGIRHPGPVPAGPVLRRAGHAVSDRNVSQERFRTDNGWHGGSPKPRSGNSCGRRSGQRRKTATMPWVRQRSLPTAFPVSRDVAARLC